MPFSQTCPLQNGKPGIWWLDFFFGKCLYTGWDAASSVFGAASVVLWLMALLPQVHTNWRLKSTSGLSPAFLLFWLIGDTMSLVGCLALNQKLFQLFLSSYFVMTDVVLCTQYYLYKDNNNHTKDIAAIMPMVMVDDSTTPNETSGLLTSTTLTPDMHYNGQDYLTTTPLLELPKNNSYPSQQQEEKKLWQRTSVRMSMLAVIATVWLWVAVHRWWTYRPHIGITFEAIGLFMGWASSISYHMSRIPQLWHNYKRQSVDGLSLAMFTIIFAANGTYAASLLAQIPVAEPGFLYKSASYIYGPIGSMVLDIFVLLQFHILRRQAKHLARSSSTATITDIIQSA